MNRLDFDFHRDSHRSPDFDASGSGTFCLEPVKASVNEDQQKRWLKQLREMPEVRLKKIMKIRAEIAKGTYETDAKWRVALDGLIQDLRD